MPSQAVHHYLWRDYSLPFRKGWILTVTDNEALVLFSLVTTLVAYAQTRAWNIERNFFNQLTAPKIQLAVDNERSLISQGAALKALSRALSKKPSKQPETIGTTNPLIGVIAALNILVFVILGIVLPWNLSGGVEKPLVLARATEKCLRYEYPPNRASEDSILAGQTFRQYWNSHSQPSTIYNSKDRILAERPKIEVSHADICPFSGGVCKTKFRTVSFEHRRLSLRDFGVHSTSKVLLSHRLTCSPLETEKFLIIPPGPNCKNSTILFGDSRNVPIAGVEPFRRQLDTCNGPNRFSDRPSGRRNRIGNEKTQLDVWAKPAYLNKQDSNLIKFHPYLSRSDGQVFVLGLKTNPSQTYSTVIDDPFFSAHDNYLKYLYDVFYNCTYDDEYTGATCDTPISKDANETKQAFLDIMNATSFDLPPTIMPDQEYTAIGCVEQHQFCIQRADMFCTTWGLPEDIYEELTTTLPDMGDQTTLNDFQILHRHLVFNSTVKDYLYNIGGVEALLAWDNGLNNAWNYSYGPLTNVDPLEQWISESKAWMEISLLQSRYMMLNILHRPRGTPLPYDPYTDIEINRNYCSRILFHDGSYTNFDFIQLMIILSCLVILCALSFESVLFAAAKAIGKLRRDALKLPKMAYWPTSKPLLPWHRDEPREPSRKYPRNPFRDVHFRLRLEEHGLRDLSAAPAALR